LITLSGTSGYGSLRAAWLPDASAQTVYTDTTSTTTNRFRLSGCASRVTRNCIATSPWSSAPQP